MVERNRVTGARESHKFFFYVGNKVVYNETYSEATTYLTLKRPPKFNLLDFNYNYMCQKRVAKTKAWHCYSLKMNSK